MKTPKSIRTGSLATLSDKTYYLYSILQVLFGNCTDGLPSEDQLVTAINNNSKLNSSDNYIYKSYGNYDYKISYTINNDNISNDRNVMFVDCLADYNFYSKCYEKNLDGKEVLDLPFYYGSAKNIKDKEIDDLYFLGDFNLGNGVVKKETIVRDINMFNKSLTSYSASYSQSGIPLASSVLSKIENYEIYNSKNFSELTPFNIKTYMNVDFNTNGLSSLVNSYDEAALNSLFLKINKKDLLEFFDLFSSMEISVENLRNRILDVLKVFAYIFKNYDLKIKNNIENLTSELSLDLSVRNQIINTTDVLRREGFLDISIPTQQTSTDVSIGFVGPTRISVTNFIKKRDLITKFEEQNNFKVRTEPVGYVIEKYIGNALQETNFFSADNKLDLATFHDTRIKNSIVNVESLALDYKYTYKFKQILCVYAFKVKYNFVEENNILRLVSYELIPSPYFVKKELTDSDVEISVFDDPPLFPDVKFISDVGVNNKIRIFMNHNVGSHISIPKYLNNEENSYFKKIHALQKSLKYRQLADNKVLFREDDVGNKYEIYKIEHYPESYSDFDSNLIQIPDSEFIAPSYTYFDLIEPNKKYYYMFRTKDVHNQLSDMSYIYEVELFNDEGVIIPNIKIVEPRIEQPNKIPFKKFKKRVKIRPNLGQLLYSKNANGAEKFGASEFGSILNKNLCLRVTSKQTGRIVEYKFKFVTTKQEPENTQQEQINNC